MKTTTGIPLLAFLTACVAALDCGGLPDCTSDEIAAAAVPVSGSLSGAVTGTISGGTLYLAQEPDEANTSIYLQNNGASLGVALANPAGATSASVSTSFYFDSLPSAGTFVSSLNLPCANLEFNCSGPSGCGDSYYTAPCPGSSTPEPAGSFTLTLSSVSQVCGGGGLNVYKVHGTVTAAMSDITTPADPPIDLALSF